MKKRNAKNSPQLNRKATNKPQAKTIDKKLYMIGAAVLVAVVVFTAVLIWYYGDSVVARVNGTNIRGSEVSQVLSGGMQNDVNMGMRTQRDANEGAVRQIAFVRLYEEYARQNGIALTGNESPTVLMGIVAEAVVADPSLFASFEAYMPEDEFQAAEARAAAILERALAGEDFDELVALYSEDGMPPEGYAFIEGAMVEEFCEAARALEIGEISDLVLTQFGFHIILRTEPPEDPDFIMTPFGQIPPPLETDDELLGAKHILIGARPTTDEERMHQAVSLGFTAKLDAADLTFLRRLDDITGQVHSTQDIHIAQ